MSKKDQKKEVLCDQKLKEKSRFFSLSRKKMNISWYVKLNIMIIGFLFVLFLIKQLNTSTFKAGLNKMFFIADSPDRSVRLKIAPSKSKKKANLR